MSKVQATGGRKHTSASTVGLLDSTLRSSHCHALILLDRLPEPERRGLVVIDEAREIYGVLRSTGSDPPKIVNHALALLLLTLRDPGPLPAFYRRQCTPAELERQVALLIADRILDVEVNGSFLTGAPALAALGLQAEISISAISEKSRLAMRYAAAADSAEREVASQLYRFGSLPSTLRWRRQLPGHEAVLLFLCKPEHPALERSFPEDDFPWISWRRRDGRHQIRGPAFKLYISPKLEHLPQVFTGLFEVLQAGRASSLKVGADADNLLRTDKLIAYFDSFEDLAECADSLRRRFAGIPVDGVPFSAQIDDDGLLSWGLDPPAKHGSRGSWRSKIVVRIARAILEGRRQGVADPAEWATIHLGLQGVDAQEWRPRADLHDIAEV